MRKSDMLPGYDSTMLLNSISLDRNAVLTLARAIFVFALNDWRICCIQSLDASSSIYRSVVNFFSSTFCHDIMQALFPEEDPSQILSLIRNYPFASLRKSRSMADSCTPLDFYLSYHRGE